MKRESDLRSAFVGVIAIACAVRYVAWVRLGGPITAVDSITYRTVAQAIARGDFSEFARLPFYFLYPLTLSPLYALSLPEARYIEWLHILVSTATVWVMMRMAARLVSGRAGLLVGIAAAVYPFFLFWLPYVLTETLFLFCLALYVDAFLRVLESPRAKTVAGYVVAAVIFALSRPSAVVCLAFSWLVLAASVAARRVGLAKGLALTLLAAVAVAAAGAAAMASSSTLRNRVLSMPTIGETLYKVREAADFIRRHPGAYLGMVSRKMVAYWFPWAFAESWSASHRLLDGAVSVALTVLALLSLKRRAMAPWAMAALILMTLSFALLSAFGQIDPDARYRLPAELLALVLGAGAIQLQSTQEEFSHV